MISNARAENQSSRVVQSPSQEGIGTLTILREQPFHSKAKVGQKYCNKRGIKTVPHLPEFSLVLHKGNRLADICHINCVNC